MQCSRCVNQPWQTSRVRSELYTQFSPSETRFNPFSSRCCCFGLQHNRLCCELCNVVKFMVAFGNWPFFSTNGKRETFIWRRGLFVSSRWGARSVLRVAPVEWTKWRNRRVHCAQCCSPLRHPSWWIFMSDERVPQRLGDGTRRNYSANLFQLWNLIVGYVFIVAQCTGSVFSHSQVKLSLSLTNNYFSRASFSFTVYICMAIIDWNDTCFWFMKN